MSYTILLLLSFFTQDLWAFKLNLTDYILDVDEGEYSTTATIINDSRSMIAIEATARVRTYNIQGEEKV